MKNKNVIINGLKVPVPEETKVKDIIEKFFDLRCEFLVGINSKALPANQFQTKRIKENDFIQVITYSKHCYKLNKRTIFKPDKKTKDN